MVLVDGIEGIVGRILTGRIEDIVIALVLLREAWLSGSAGSGKEQHKKEHTPTSQEPLHSTFPTPKLSPSSPILST